MITLLCMSLLFHQRAQFGHTETRHEIYRDERKEYCFETTYFIGRTWFEDKVIGSVEVSMEECE